ncbi:MAG: hypothetical protein NTU61_05335 [Candidatus Altiarchaeota archaeon]|nr:hypothetical protein [Candidatus Altiarchaeota archaeon]
MKKHILCLGALLVLFSTLALAAQSNSSTSSVSPTNMIVDFDATSFDSNLRAGDSGVMNLVIKNTGGRPADNVQVLLPSTAVVHLDKKFSVSRMDAGISKTFPVIVRVDSNAKSGLNAVQVQISYDGYYSDGTADNNRIVNLEIPFRIYGNPSFQIIPSKTTYFKDNLEAFELQGVTMDSVKGVEATLSSSCVTVIGSSRTYVGDINSNQTFKLVYQIKPSDSGACVASLQMAYTDESGNRAQDNISLGLNVEEAGVDFKVVNMSYAPTGPGETVKVKIILKNVGSANADDTTVTLTLASPFAPVESQEKYIGRVGGGQTIDADFNIAVGWDATTQAYSIPMTINYKVGGTSYSVEKDIGLDVSGRVILEVINVDSSRGSVRIDVANIGTRTADGVKATLTTGGASTGSGGTQNFSRGSGGQGNFSLDGMENRSRSFNATGDASQSYVSYKSDIKPSKQTTFTFTASATGSAILTLEYTGLNNERVTQTERITLSSGGSTTGGTGTTSGVSRNGGISITTLALYAAVILVVAFVAYKLYKRRKTKVMTAGVKKESK